MLLSHLKTDEVQRLRDGPISHITGKDYVTALYLTLQVKIT